MIRKKELLQRIEALEEREEHIIDNQNKIVETPRCFFKKK